MTQRNFVTDYRLSRDEVFVAAHSDRYELPMVDPMRNLCDPPKIARQPDMHVKAIGGFCVAGRAVEIGEIVTVDNWTARDLAGRGLAVILS